MYFQWMVRIPTPTKLSKNSVLVIVPFLFVLLCFLSHHGKLAISKLTCVTCIVLATSIFLTYTDSPVYIRTLSP